MEFKDEIDQRLIAIEMFTEQCKVRGIRAQIVPIETPCVMLYETAPRQFSVVADGIAAPKGTELIAATVKTFTIDGFKDEGEPQKVLRPFSPGEENSFFDEWYKKFAEQVKNCSQVFVYMAPLLGVGELYLVDPLRYAEAEIKSKEVALDLENKTPRSGITYAPEDIPLLALRDVEKTYVVNVMARFWTADMLESESAAAMALKNALGGFLQ